MIVQLNVCESIQVHFDVFALGLVERVNLRQRVPKLSQHLQSESLGLGKIHKMLQRQLKD